MSRPLPECFARLLESQGLECARIVQTPPGGIQLAHLETTVWASAGGIMVITHTSDAADAYETNGYVIHQYGLPTTEKDEQSRNHFLRIDGHIQALDAKEFFDLDSLRQHLEEAQSHCLIPLQEWIYQSNTLNHGSTYSLGLAADRQNTSFQGTTRLARAAHQAVEKALSQCLKTDLTVIPQRLGMKPGAGRWAHSLVRAAYADAGIATIPPEDSPVLANWLSHIQSLTPLDYHQARLRSGANVLHVLACGLEDASLREGFLALINDLDDEVLATLGHEEDGRGLTPAHYVVLRMTSAPEDDGGRSEAVFAGIMRRLNEAGALRLDTESFNAQGVIHASYHRGMGQISMLDRCLRVLLDVEPHHPSIVDEPRWKPFSGSKTDVSSIVDRASPLMEAISNKRQLRELDREVPRVITCRRTPRL